jgi:hypothetical protein
LQRKEKKRKGFTRKDWYKVLHVVAWLTTPFKVCPHCVHASKMIVSRISQGTCKKREADADADADLESSGIVGTSDEKLPSESTLAVVVKSIRFD